MNQDVIGTAEAANSFSSILVSHLQYYGIIQTYNYHSNHCDGSIVKHCKTLAEKKNKLRKDINSSTGEKGYFGAVRAHNKMLKHAKKLAKHQRITNEERLYKKNPWQFAKETCNTKSKLEPTFSKEEALNYFSNSFSSEYSKYSSLPDWVYTAFQPPNITEEFDLSPITPSIIKMLLKRCTKPSAPGMDKITYAQLRNLPTCHHFLAILYTKIMGESMEAPSQWGQGKSY